MRYNDIEIRGMTPENGGLIKMKKVIGTCGKTEKNIVYWVEGEYIAIPAANVTIVTYTRDRNEALAICRRNLLNFVEA